MAAYTALDALRTDGDLLSRVRVACLVSCETIRTELTSVTNHDKRLVWARETLQDPENAARDLIGAVLAQNKSATVATIQGATDATIQTAVDNAVALMLV